MRKVLSLVAFVVLSVFAATALERVLCLLVECDMELVGYILNDPIILIAYSAIAVILCFIPSVWLMNKIGKNASVGAVPLAIGALVAVSGIKNNVESAVIMGLWVFVPLLAANITGLFLWPKHSSGTESGNA
ncbi:MAG: hypothetical protein PVI97_19650 [Candidatus Thiodiazotropha sp.]|jgi:hypothetical protein